MYTYISLHGSHHVAVKSTTTNTPVCACVCACSWRTHLWVLPIAYSISLNSIHLCLHNIMIQGGDDPRDALSCGPLSAKEPLIIGLFCGKCSTMIGHSMGLGHSVLITCHETQMYWILVYYTHACVHTRAQAHIMISSYVRVRSHVCVCEISRYTWIHLRLRDIHYICLCIVTSVHVYISRYSIHLCLRETHYICLCITSNTFVRVRAHVCACAYVCNLTICHADTNVLNKQWDFALRDIHYNVCVTFIYNICVIFIYNLCVTFIYNLCVTFMYSLTIFNTFVSAWHSLYLRVFV